MDKRLVGQFKIVVRKNETTNNVSIEIANYPVSTAYTTSGLDVTPLDDIVDDAIGVLLPSIRATIRELYERAKNAQ